MRISDGSSDVCSSDLVASDPLKIGGVAITLVGSAQAGDKFLVQPTVHAAGQLKLATSDAGKIAAATAVNASAASGNSSTVGTISVSDGRNANLIHPVTIRLNDANRSETRRVGKERER